METRSVGFVGLGNMGGALASNLVQAGFAVVAHDIVGPDRAPEGASFAPALAELARQVEVVVLSLPDGTACEQVVRETLAAPDRRVTHVVDTSTVGVRAAESLAESLAKGGVSYVDAPVSGGVAGAACASVAPVLAALSDQRHRVGDRPGMAQAMKLANNFLSATALAATSEAIAFGQSVGLDMGTMLEVLNGASGQSAATRDKFPNHVLTGRYASGFRNSLMAKDVQLYLSAVSERSGPSALGEITASTWQRFAAAEPGADFTRIFPFVSRADPADAAERAESSKSGGASETTGAPRC